VVTVASTGGSNVASTAEKAILLIIDTSGSMSKPGSKIHAARQATATAIAAIPDGALFAVVQGTDHAQLLYPLYGDVDFVAADDHNRAQAIRAVRGLQADGGTAMSKWLDLATALFEKHPGAIRIAYLVTDGKNESEPHDALEAALDRAIGAFQCDTRGVGA